ncbi:hypothetical protein J6590_105285 [Homalodisca vitripennis]|nr:hypothetical protein J6590_105285 [Homalodisca vitripennis]
MVFSDRHSPDSHKREKCTNSLTPYNSCSHVCAYFCSERLGFLDWGAFNHFLNVVNPFSAKHIGQVASHKARVTGVGCPVGCRGIATKYFTVAPGQFYEVSDTELNHTDVHVGGFSLDNGPDVVIASPEPLYLDYDSDIIPAIPDPCSRVIVPTSRIPQQAHVPSERILSQLNFLVYNSERYRGAPLLFVRPLSVN